MRATPCCCVLLSVLPLSRAGHAATLLAATILAATLLAATLLAATLQAATPLPAAAAATDLHILDIRVAAVLHQVLDALALLLGRLLKLQGGRAGGREGRGAEGCSEVVHVHVPCPAAAADSAITISSTCGYTSMQA
jgi:hypothetical protein